jgi:carotenoid cleavage dioxygenase-like enzyme
MNPSAAPMKFPATRNFTGFFAPSGVEAEVLRLPVEEGAIPEDLDGVFYRVAPDPQLPPLAGDDIWFNGDGMVTAFRFHRGEVSLRQRWVRTEKFALERVAGRALFGAYRNPLTDLACVRGKVRGTANTNVVFHAGKLLALKEDSRPVAMDPVTLETLGEWNFHGALTSETFTAHPKVDPATGEMLAFGYAAKGLLTRDMAFYVIDAEGRIKREVWFELPYYCMMHDFGITADYALFHVVPIVGSWERLKQGQPHFGFDRKLPVHLGVLPRNGTARDLRWFTAPNLFASHVMNAFSEGGRICFDTPTAAGNMFPFFPDVDGAPFDPERAQSRLTRWSVDLGGDGDRIGMSRLTEVVGEFPRIDERFTGRPYAHGFLLAQDLTKPVDLPAGRGATGMMMNTLVHLDLEQGRTDAHWIGPASSLQEPAFIPRPGSTAEADGYLVLVENRLAQMGSRLLLYRADRVAAGPLAAITVPFRLRPGLHGNWVARARLAAS